MTSFIKIENFLESLDLFHLHIEIPQALPYESAEVILEERRRLLALSAAVGSALAGDDALRTILQRCAEALVQHLGVAAAYIWTLDTNGMILEMQAGAGVYTPLGDFQGAIRVGESIIGRMALDRQPYVISKGLHDGQIVDSVWAERRGITAFAGYPLVVEDRTVGAMAMFAGQPFTSATLHALTWMAGVIAMGIDRIYISDALARSMTKVVRMNKSLRHKNVELDEFTYVASHDLQEPLRKLKIFSSMLRSDIGDNLPDRAEKDVAFIVDAATRMQTLIDSMLNLSQAGNDAMQYDEVILDACVDRALEALEAGGQATIATIVRDPLPTVQGDGAMLTRLYQNLLSNALKFNNKRCPVIRLTAEQQGERLVLGVHDNGIGIKPEYHEQIFIPFKRLHGRDEYEGTGIGLAICRKTVERHGGRIWVESRPGKGTHLRFTLARRQGER